MDNREKLIWSYDECVGFSCPFKADMVKCWLIKKERHTLGNYAYVRYAYIRNNGGREFS